MISQQEKRDCFRIMLKELKKSATAFSEVPG